MLSTKAIVGMFCVMAAGVLYHNTEAQYIWDYMPTPLNADQVYEMFLNAVPGETFPMFNTPPETSFTCEGRIPGYYADQDAGCQAFRRCTYNGDMFSFLCPNGTVFNQLFGGCDWWFNVDCSQAANFYDFFNSRIYDENADLHDTPPADYLPPWLREQK